MKRLKSIGRSYREKFEERNSQLMIANACVDRKAKELITVNNLLEESKELNSKNNNAILDLKRANNDLHRQLKEVEQSLQAVSLDNKAKELKNEELKAEILDVKLDLKGTMKIFR